MLRRGDRQTLTSLPCNPVTMVRSTARMLRRGNHQRRATGRNERANDEKAGIHYYGWRSRQRARPHVQEQPHIGARGYPRSTPDVCRVSWRWLVHRPRGHRRRGDRRDGRRRRAKETVTPNAPDGHGTNLEII